MYLTRCWCWWFFQHSYVDEFPTLAHLNVQNTLRKEVPEQHPVKTVLFGFWGGCKRERKRKMTIHLQLIAWSQSKERAILPNQLLKFWKFENDYFSWVDCMSFKNNWLQLIFPKPWGSSILGTLKGGKPLTTPDHSQTPRHTPNLSQEQGERWAKLHWQNYKKPSQKKLKLC